MLYTAGPDSDPPADQIANHNSAVNWMLLQPGDDARLLWPEVSRVFLPHSLFMRQFHFQGVSFHANTVHVCDCCSN